MIINDEDLIHWFKNEYKSIEFIKHKPEYKRIDRYSRLDHSISDLKTKKELCEQKEILIEIWKDLVATAIIFLKFKDDRECHHDDGDYGIDDLGDFFQSYCDFEKFLYGGGEYYRDHVSHVFKVFLLGEKLVRERLGGFSSIDVMDDKLELYLFSWDEVPGADSERLLKYLLNKYDIDWAKTENIRKSDDDKTICIDKGENSAKILLDELNGKATLKIDDGRTHDLKVKKENGTRKIIESKLITAEEKEAMWCIASLTHDLGYPTEVVNEIHDKLRGMLKIFNIQDVSYILSQQSQLFNDSIIKLISSDLVKIENDTDDIRYATHTQAKYYLKFSRSIEKWDHGIESCIVLVKSLIYFLETDFSIDRQKLMDIDDARQFLIRQRILRAIASHNCDFIYHLKLDLSFLLRLIDEMQEWGRPKLTDLFIKSPEATFEYEKFQKDMIEYSIKFSYGDQRSEDAEKKLHENIKEYFRRKIDAYITILRSAVDGKQREFVLAFNVIDDIGEKEHKYKFIHEKPDNIIYKFDDGKIGLAELDKDIEVWDKFYAEHFKN